MSVFTVVLDAAACRGVARTRQVEASLARRRGGQRIRVVPTDERLVTRDPSRPL